jgi:hypothetical protein
MGSRLASRANRTDGTGLHSSNALLAQSVEHLHGKEGVDGSSPSEGSAGSRMVAGGRGSAVVGQWDETPVVETRWKRDAEGWL